MALALTFWDNQNNPVNTTVDRIMDALRNDDMREGLMYEPCTLDDVLDGTTPAETLIMDAIVSQYAKLTAKMNIMQRVMSRAGVEFKNADGENQPLNVAGFQISEPFMRLGTANVVALFELSDGQTVSIYFHNPDVTPKKITPADEVISFKWLLNKKDITIVVAPEKGKDIDVRQVAMRIMKIAAKNSAAFARQNKNRQERVAKVTALRERVAQKEKLLAQKVKKIDELKYLKAQEEVDQILAEEEAQKQAKIEAEKPDTKIERITLNWSEGDGDVNRKVFNTLDDLQRWFLQTYPSDYLISMRQGSYSKNQVEFDLVHKDGSKESYQDRIDVGLGNGDFDPNREHFMETGGNKYKERLSARGVREFDYTPSLTMLSANSAENQADEQDEQSIVITGKEFGNFDLSNEEGKAQLRRVVREHLENNLKGKWVKNYALNRDIEIRQRGIEEMISWSANPKKLQIAAVIEQVIATAKPKNGIESWEENTKKVKKPDVKGYYRFTNNVNINGENVSFDVLIEQDEKGLLHYDFILPKKPKTIMDDVGIGSDTQSEKDQQTTMASDDTNHNAILDDAQGEHMINIILLDKDGNDIPDDEPQEDQPIVITGKEFGEFDTSTREGKAALREKAFEHLKSLAERGESVFCKAVNADVGFTKSAAKKYKSLGGNPIKLKLASMIKGIIKNSTLVRKGIESYDAEEQKAGITYDVVKTKVQVEGQEYGVRTVLRHLSDGKYQYDLQVKDNFDTILDSIKGSPARLTKSDVASLEVTDRSGPVNKTDFFHHSVTQSELQLDDTLTLDDVSSGYVLNLFVFDKDGNEIKDEEDEGSELTVKLSNAYDYVLEKIFNGNKDGQLLTVTNPETKEIIYSKFYDNLPKTFSKILDSTQKRYKNYDVEFKNAPRYSGSPDIQSEELNKLSAALLKQLGYEIDEAVSQEKLESLPFPEGSYVARTIDEIEYAYSVEKYLNLHSKDREPAMVVKDLSGSYIGRHDISFVKENFRQVSKEEAEMIAAKFNYEEVARYENSKGTLIALVSKNTYGYDIGVEDGRKPINMDPLGKVIEHLKYLKEINPSMKCVKGVDLLNGYEVVKPEKDFLEPVNLKPRKPTLKQLGISDSSSRIIKSINERYPNGWSNMHFADVNTPAYIQAAIDSGKYFVTENDIGRAMHLTQGEKATPVTAANEDKMKVVVLKSENLQMAINAHYFNYFMYHYPNAEVFISNSEAMAGFKVNNELVGVVMGMNLGGAFRAKIDAALNEQAAKESEVNNEQQGEPMQPEEKTQLDEDHQFLQDVIDGKVDVFASDFNERLIKVASELQETQTELVNQAANVYAAKMADKAKQALGAM